MSLRYGTRTVYGSVLVPFGIHLVPSPRLFNEVFHKVQMSIVGCLDHGTMNTSDWIKTHPPTISSQKNILGRQALRNLQLLEQQREGPRAKVFCLGSPEAHTQWERDTWTLLTGEASLKSMAAPFSTKAFTITWQRLATLLTTLFWKVYYHGYHLVSSCFIKSCLSSWLYSNYIYLIISKYRLSDNWTQLWKSPFLNSKSSNYMGYQRLSILFFIVMFNYLYIYIIIYIYVNRKCPGNICRHLLIASWFRHVASHKADLGTAMARPGHGTATLRWLCPLGPNR